MATMATMAPVALALFGPRAQPVSSPHGYAINYKRSHASSRPCGVTSDVIWPLWLPRVPALWRGGRCPASARVCSGCLQAAVPPEGGGGQRPEARGQRPEERQRCECGCVSVPQTLPV